MTAKQILIALTLLISSALVSSRLVVYGPTELKNKFEFQGNEIFSPRHYLTDLIIDYKIKANYANFGNIPYG